MSNRYFLDYTVSRRHEDEVFLAGDEAHHFAKVMRGAVGDSIVLFDGTGPYSHGIVKAVQKGCIQIHITQTFADDVESPLRLTVASALPKGDRQRFLIEKLAELGVVRFIPVQMERSVARAHDAVVQRFRRYVIEAAKQCGRNVLMEIESEVTMSQLAGKIKPETEKFILHPTALGSVGQITPRQVWDEYVSRPDCGTHGLKQSSMMLIGPEGSFTDREIELAICNGFVPLDLGRRILRTETACIAAASVFLCGMAVCRTT